jgi:hypothetical protein
MRDGGKLSYPLVSMAITTSASITFQQPGMNFRAKMHLPKATSLAAAKTFAEAFAEFTEASIIAVSFSQEEALEIVGGGNDMLNRRANVSFRGEATKSKVLAVPAPKENIFELVAGEGLKIKKVSGEALATMYSNLTGESFEFVRGRLFSGG